MPKAIESLADQLFKMIACGSDFSAVITGKYPHHCMYGSFFQSFIAEQHCSTRFVKCIFILLYFL